MAKPGTAAERLRDFVRERVKRGGELYEWGAGLRLGEAIGKPSSWMSQYLDEPPLKHADLDTALRICDFFGVEVSRFREDSGGKRGPDQSRHTTDQGLQHGRPHADHPTDLAARLQRIAASDKALAADVQRVLASLTRVAIELEREDRGALPAEPRRRRSAGKAR